MRILRRSEKKPDVARIKANCITEVGSTLLNIQNNQTSTRFMGTIK